MITSSTLLELTYKISSLYVKNYGLQCLYRRTDRQTDRQTDGQTFHLVVSGQRLCPLSISLSAVQYICASEIPRYIMKSSFKMVNGCNLRPYQISGRSTNFKMTSLFGMINEGLKTHFKSNLLCRLKLKTDFCQITKKVNYFNENPPLFRLSSCYQ